MSGLAYRVFTDTAEYHAASRSYHEHLLEVFGRTVWRIDVVDQETGRIVAWRERRAGNLTQEVEVDPQPKRVEDGPIWGAAEELLAVLDTLEREEREGAEAGRVISEATHLLKECAERIGWHARGGAGFACWVQEEVARFGLRVSGFDPPAFASPFTEPPPMPPANTGA